LGDTIPAIATKRTKPRVVIIGAGVVGLGIAWRLAGRAIVTLFDRAKAGSGASYAAAGMLAACCEAEPGEQALVALGRESQKRWPAFADELLRVSGIDVELRREGTLVLALTADDQATIAHGLEFQRSLGLPLEWLSAAATRAREPRLAGKIAGALFSPEDHQVDNRKLAQALRIAAEAAGAEIREHRPVKEISVQGGQARGVVLEAGRRTGGRRCDRSRARCWRCAWMRRRRCFRTCCGHRACIWCRAATADSLSAARSRRKALTTPSPPAAS
jgi:glycine oxidase